MEHIINEILEMCGYDIEYVKGLIVELENYIEQEDESNG